jgi:hypothetical protein
MNFLSFIAVFVVAIPVLGDGFRFPSDAVCQSPDGKWNLTSQSPIKDAADLSHLLLLTRVKGGRIKLRRSFDRTCEVLWSPDSSCFALTDECTSDRSDVYIYSAAGRVSKKSLGEQFPTTAISQEELAGHCYFEACEWLDRHRLRIKISGRTDGPDYNFEHEFIYDLRSGRFEPRKK